MSSSQDFHHLSVLREEVVMALVTKPDGYYLDCTVGGAGHAEALLEAAGSQAQLIGLDQDPAALQAASVRLDRFSSRTSLVRGNFRYLDKTLVDVFGSAESVVDGILFDLGVSSPQLDLENRGFSYWGHAPLDMRMNPDGTETAATLLAQRSEEELTAILRDYGEERWAARIAAFIVRERSQYPITTNDQLVEIIKRAIPAAARREGGHPARRTFQALRIAVNDELGALEHALGLAVRALKPRGRLAVISFHSLEDRIVKQTLQREEHPCQCPSKYPCVCGLKPSLHRLHTKPIISGEAELAANPRARSAKLRVAERLERL